MDHIISRCEETSICEDAVSIKAVLYLQLGKTKDAIDLLEDMADPGRISNQNDMMLAQAYYQAGETENAKSYVQIRTYTHLISMLAGETLFLALYEKELERCRERICRVRGVIELYQLEKLHPNLTAQFYYYAAVVYGMNGRPEEALEMLSHFTDCVCSILRREQDLLHGDLYFDRLDEWIERLPLGNMAPMDLEFARQNSIAALSHPAFADLRERSEFQKMYARLA
ncbi:MAG: hypothetical protein MR332_02950 [Fusicatenibacter sp.]|nr:hypothetical protein [Fusicatenibacter sp.]